MRKQHGSLGFNIKLKFKNGSGRIKFMQAWWHIRRKRNYDLPDSNLPQPIGIILRKILRIRTLNEGSEWKQGERI